MGWREHSAIQGSESAVRRSWASLGAPQPDTWLPHWGLCPAKKRSRQPHPHPREHACYFGRPPPLMYSGLATVGVPPAPAGGGGPVTHRDHRAPHAHREPPGGRRLSPLMSRTGCGDARGAANQPGASAGSSALSSTGTSGARRETRGISAARKTWSASRFGEAQASQICR